MWERRGGAMPIQQHYKVGLYKHNENIQTKVSSHFSPRIGEANRRLI
jgi:hypothetical protein